MAVTATSTNFDLLHDALRKIGVIAQDQRASADEMVHARRQLSRMLKAWQNRGPIQWLTAAGTVTLTTASSYTLDPVRPLEIQSVRLRKSGRDLPLTRLTREEYDNLPNKAQTGRPTSWYYDRQREDAVLRIWPSLSVAAGETLQYTYTREIEDVTDAAAADVPGEWYDAVVYGLAARLTDDYSIQAPNVIARAEALLSDALASDGEGSVWFLADEYEYDYRYAR